MSRFAFFDRVFPGKSEPVIAGDGIFLRMPRMSDYRQWAELRAASRDFLQSWEPAWPAGDLTPAAYRRRLKRYRRDLHEDRGYAFFLFREEDACLLGGLALSNLRRGVSQSALLGYWIGAPHARRGYMSRAVACLLPFAFETLRLHRIEAACMPNNVPSRRLLEKAGFVREGSLRRYLKINGSWQDHVLYSVLAEDRARAGERSVGAAGPGKEGVVLAR